MSPTTRSLAAAAADKLRPASVWTVEGLVDRAFDEFAALRDRLETDHSYVSKILDPDERDTASATEAALQIGIAIGRGQAPADPPHDTGEASPLVRHARAALEEADAALRRAQEHLDALALGDQVSVEPGWCAFVTARESTLYFASRRTISRRTDFYDRAGVDPGAVVRLAGTLTRQAARLPERPLMVTIHRPTGAIAHPLQVISRRVYEAARQRAAAGAGRRA